MNNIIQKRIENIINDNMMQYGKYVIKNRAIPSIEDGLKPVYRRILYSMYKHKCTSFTKSATASGYVFPFHPHGDTYGTIVGLVQADNNITPLLDGKGNFGQHTSRELAPAAARYTEIKLSDMTKDIFKELNKDVVNWIPNYDGTLEMPEFLPVRFPMILHIAQEGIAVGMSNRMPSFNINDICSSMIKYINTNEKTILIPDFSTGGNLVVDNDVFKKINFEGKGTLKIRGKAEINENSIIVTEIPYSTTREKIIDSIVKLVKDKKITEITSVKDLTGLKGMKIEIICKKKTDMNLILEKLYKMTTLEDSYPCNMNILHNGLPKVLGVWEIIDKWLEWRNECLINLKKGENLKIKSDLKLLYGFKNVINDLDRLINIIRYSDNDIAEEVMNVFNIDREQAEYIVNMKIKNINKVYIQDKIDKINSLEKMILDNDNFITNKNLRDSYIINDLKDIMQKFSKDRKTNLINITKTPKSLIDKKNTKKEEKDFKATIYITQEGYIKKVINQSGDQKLKAGDKVIHEFDVLNSDEVLVFINTDAYKIYISDLNVSKLSDFGQYIPSILKLDNSDSIIGYSIINKDYKFNIIHYDNGKIAKISIESFKTDSKRKKLSNSLSKSANVVSITPMKNEAKIILINDKNKEKISSTENLDLKVSRGAQGSTLWRNIKKVIISNE